LVAVFVAVVTLSLWAVSRLQSAVNINRRLANEAPLTALAPTRSSLVKREGVSNPLLAWIQSSTSINNDEERNLLRKRLALAGIDYHNAPALFVIARFGAAIGLPLIFIAAQGFSDKPMVGFGLIISSLVLSGLGLILPQALVSRIGTIRKTTIENQFPDALDLMVVCVEAGLGLEAAFVRVGHEISESHPRIAEAFRTVSEELRAGRSRADALRSLGERSDVSALKSFAALLIQTDALGTSIATTLRTYSHEMRETRLLKAEEKAMRIPVLMTVPLVACILPVIVTALLLPAIIDVIRVIIPQLRGTI